MCIFVVIQIFWSLRKYRLNDDDGDSDGDAYGDDDPGMNALTAPEPLLASAHSSRIFPQYWYWKP